MRSSDGSPDPGSQVCERLGTDQQPVSAVLSLDDIEGVAHVAPLLGLNPDLTDDVVAVYVGIGREIEFVGHNPDAETWVRCAHATAKEFRADPSGPVDLVVRWLEAQYPERTFAVLRNGQSGGPAARRN